MRHLGNIAAGQTPRFFFSTNDGSGAAIAPTTAGTVRVYRDDETTPITAGVTYTPSFGGMAGINAVAINTSAAAYAAAHDYTVALVGAVIDCETVNAVLAEFSIENRHPSPNACADALLDRADAIETDATPRQTLHIVAAVLAGKVTGAGTGVERFTGIDGTTQRVQVATDAAGNRTAVAYSSD